MAEGKSAEKAHSGDDESQFILTNLEYVQRFLVNMKERENVLPAEIKSQYFDFKDNMNKLFLTPSDTNALVPQRKSDDEIGAIPKQSKPKISSKKPEDSSDLSGEERKSSSDALSDVDSKTSTQSSLLSITNPPNLAQWHAFLDRIDRRKMPVLENFDETSGLHLTKYFAKFEKYCMCNFGCDRDFWIGELERHLEGRTLVQFRAMKGSNDSYNVVKKKILEWYSEMEVTRQEKNKNTFKTAKMERGENMHLYGTRLEKLFKQAYPFRKVNCSRTLQEKYKATVPKAFRKKIDSQLMNHCIKEQEMTWKSFLKCARFYDLELEKQEVPEATEEIVINIGQGLKMDASVQCSNEYVEQPKPAANVARDHQHRRSYAPTHLSDTPGYRRRQQNNNGERTIWRRLDADIRSMGKSCSFCRRLGHTVDECRSRWNQCFICGSSDHFLRNCPDYRISRFSTRPATRSSSQPPQRYQERPSRQRERYGSSNSLQHQPHQPLNRNALDHRW